MSDTMTVMTACPCGEAYDSHWIDDDFWCPGGNDSPCISVLIVVAPWSMSGRRLEYPRSEASVGGGSCRLGGKDRVLALCVVEADDE